MEDQDITVKVYSKFEESTGESILAVDTAMYQQVKLSKPNGDGSYTCISKDFSPGSAYSYMSIAWGDDNKGGVISRWSDENINTEFYNGSGNLFDKSYGQTNLYTEWLEWYETESGYYNITDIPGITSAPDAFYINSSGEYSTDGTTFNAMPAGYSNEYSFYYKAGTAWTSGDADYFMDKQYPLKHLLPLTSGFSSFDLVQEEGETYSGTWIDWDGTQQTWSWTDYRYFIDKDGDKVMDEGSDIRVNGINFEDVYLWSATDASYTKQKTAFLYTSDILPAYFQFSSDDQGIVDTVTAELNKVYADEFDSISLSDYSDQLITVSSLAEFAELE